MKITRKIAQQMIDVLDDLREQIQKESKTKYPYAEWEKKREDVKRRIEKLPEYIEEAASMITVQKTRGPEKELDLVQRTTLFLFARLMNKSNRDMELIVLFLQPLFDTPVSYKTIERLYSDPLVQMALFNLHILILKKKGINDIDCAGDGTGYTLLIKEHYASYAQKLKDKAKENNPKEKKRIKCVYSFAIIDIKSRLYIAYGASLKSEQEAFFEAVKMLKAIDVQIRTMRLDRYFSAEFYVNLLLEQVGNIKFFIVPKINVANIGLGEWGKMLTRFVDDTKLFLKDYFQRNQSESGFSEDKKRTGWKIFQKKPERIDTANAVIYAWHNLFWLGS